MRACYSTSHDDNMTIVATLPLASKKSHFHQPSATSPLFFDNLPPLGRTFRQTFQGGFVVDTFVEMLAPMGEIVEKEGTSCRRLTFTESFRPRVKHLQYENNTCKKQNVKDKMYPSQTKILEGRTTFSECVFAALLNVL
jgi:hypothetical protein